MQEEGKAKQRYVEAIEKVKAELDRNYSIQGEKAFDELRTEHFNFLNKLKQAELAREKGKLVNYLFEKALSRLSSLEVSNKPSLFLVYAHENTAYGKAEASTSKYLIEKLSQIQVVLYSDQTPIGQPYSNSLGEVKKDSKLEDILTNQLCLLPGQLRSDVKPVDKVVVCCSEVLGSYLKWPEYDSFYQKLREAYGKDREAYLKGDEQENAWAIREVVREFSEEEKYNGRFHHVLTEMAFLQIRAEHLKDGHGIIPVPLTRNSYDDCLSKFISSTTVRMGDIPRFEEQAQAGQEIYPNQSRHWVLFKLIERLLVGSDEAKTFLDKFWQGYSDCISRLKGESTFDGFEFVKRVDGIFDEIEKALHKQLASTVQQIYPAWQRVDTRLLDQSRNLAQIQTGVDSLVKQLLGNLQENIQKLRASYLDGLQQDREIKDALANYISLEGIPLHDSTRFNLESKVRDFLNSDKKSLLLLGEAGSGKSTFNRHLAVSLWEAYTQASAVKDNPIPVFIQLSSLPESNQNLVETFFKSKNFSEEQIKELQTKHRFILILDGFDEIKDRQRAFYKDNQLDDWKNAKIIISSRPEYLGSNYQYKFHASGERATLQEYRLAPFSGEAIERYVDQYKTDHSEGAWSAGQYKEALKQPDVKELVGNPFLLKITLSVLPELSETLQAKGERFTRIALYDQFVKSWFDRSQQRLAQIRLSFNEEETFRNLEQEGYHYHGIGFSEELALEMYQAGEVMTTYLAKTVGVRLEHDWRKHFLSNDNVKMKLMRLNAPLISQNKQSGPGQEYRFIHKSIQDYFVARALWEELEIDDDKIKGSSWFNRLNIVNDPAVLQFLTERVQQERELKERLLGVVERSKGEDGTQFERSAANAITALVKAGVTFNGMDLQGIRIPGADLSYGVFDSAQLQGSDLRNVNLRTSWLYQANLSGAQMSGVQFGEWPYLEEESAVNSCAYSPDGKTCAMGLNNNEISVYNTLSWEKIHTLRGHTDRVNSVVYSPSGSQIASGSDDKTVRLWDAQSGAAGPTLRGHTEYINSVVYSPSGMQIASGSYDKTVRLWNAQSGAAVHALRGHQSNVNSVVYSPSGTQIASGGWDNTVRLWSAQSGAAVHILRGHTDRVNSVVYSPSGTQIASGSGDNTVRLWDAQSGAAVHTLEGHTDTVFSVVYSPSGSQIASGSRDTTVRLWDAQSGAAVHTLEGHQSNVNSVVYSPSGTQIAAGSYDKMVRLWDAQSGAAVHTLEGHTRSVMSVVYSPSGAQLASGSKDKTVRLWEAQSGVATHTLEGHTDTVFGVAYSPSGTQLVSGSYDKTVRLWDAQSGAAVHTLEGHTDSVRSVVYSPSGSQIASGSSDNTVRLWDVQSGAAVHTLRGHTDRVNSVVYSPSGTQIASGGWDNTVRLWDAHSGVAVHTLEGHTYWVNNVVYSPSGSQLASGSRDNTVRLWDAYSGAAVHTLEGHTDDVNSVVYLPRGSQIASGSDDNTVRLWEVASGDCLRKIQGFSGGVNSVTWKATLEGSYLLTGSGDQLVRQWQVVAERAGYNAHLHWMSPHRGLKVTDILVDGVKGLSEMNIRLLKQRGARVS